MNKEYINIRQEHEEGDQQRQSTRNTATHGRQQNRENINILHTTTADHGTLQDREHRTWQTRNKESTPEQGRKHHNGEPDKDLKPLLGSSMRRLHETGLLMSFYASQLIGQTALWQFDSETIGRNDSIRPEMRNRITYISVIKLQWSRGGGSAWELLTCTRRSTHLWICSECLQLNHRQTDIYFVPVNRSGNNNCCSLSHF